MTSEVFVRVTRRIARKINRLLSGLKPLHPSFPYAKAHALMCASS